MQQNFWHGRVLCKASLFEVLIFCMFSAANFERPRCTDGINMQNAQAANITAPDIPAPWPTYIALAAHDATVVSGFVTVAIDSTVLTVQQKIAILSSFLPFAPQELQTRIVALRTQIRLQDFDPDEASAQLRDANLHGHARLLSTMWSHALPQHGLREPQVLAHQSFINYFDNDVDRARRQELAVKLGIIASYERVLVKLRDRIVALGSENGGLHPHVGSLNIAYQELQFEQQQTRNEVNLLSVQVFGPPMAIVPMGCGKTGLLAMTPFQLSHGRVLIIVPNRSIWEGFVRSLGHASPLNFYRKSGMIPVDVSVPSCSAVVSSNVSISDLQLLGSCGVMPAEGNAVTTVCAQTHFTICTRKMLENLHRMFPPDFFDLVLIDEAHHTAAATYTNVRLHFRAARFCYVTGTPNRSDGVSIDATVVYHFPRQQAIARGWLKQPRFHEILVSDLAFSPGAPGGTVFSTPEEVQNAGNIVWVRRGVARSEEANCHIIAEVLRLLHIKNEGRNFPLHKAILQASDIAHARVIVHLFNSHPENERHFSATAIASTDVEDDAMATERAERLAAFETGEFAAIVHYGTIGEGYDHPNLSICGILRPFSSQLPFEQLVGRVMRCYPPSTHDLRPDDNVADIVTHTGFGLARFLAEFINEASVSLSLRGSRRVVDGSDLRADSEIVHGVRTLSILPAEQTEFRL
jgi:superfamily II DNA or RNA helicase